MLQEERYASAVWTDTGKGNFRRDICIREKKQRRRRIPFIDLGTICLQRLGDGFSTKSHGPVNMRHGGKRGEGAEEEENSEALHVVVVKGFKRGSQVMLVL